MFIFFLTVLGLPCCSDFLSGCDVWLLIVVPSLTEEYGLLDTQVSVVAGPGL